jgi:proteasome lid subunit RPN8/RPN11
MIERDVQLQLIAALETTRSERCAALYGHLDYGSMAIGRRRWLVNREPCSYSFAASVTELLAKPIKPARLLGLFHSHPRGSALPSDLDCAGIARLPFVWAIAGFDDGVENLRGFAWSNSGVREIRCWSA